MSTGPGLIISPPFLGQVSSADRGNMPVGAVPLLRNFILRDGKVLSRPGLTDFADDVGERPSAFIHFPHSNGTYRFVMATTEGWFEYNSGTATWDDITLAGSELTGSSADQQVFRVFDLAGVTNLIGVNGKDNPKAWTGTGDYADMAGSPPVAKCMAVAFERVLLGNTDNNGRLAIDVSGYQTFESGWGTFVALLGDTPGSIIGMTNQGDEIVTIYKEDAIVFATGYAGTNPFIFDTHVEIPRRGPVSPLGIVTIEEGLDAWLAKDGTIQQFDGQSVTEVSSAAQTHIRDTMAGNKTGQVFGFFDSRRNELWFFYCGAGADEASFAVVVSRSDTTVFPLSFPTVYPSAGAAIPVETAITIGGLGEAPIGALTGNIGDLASEDALVVLGEYTGQCYTNSGATDDGAAIAIEMETGFAQMPENHDPRTIVDIELVEHQFKKTSTAQTVSVSVGVTDGASDPTFTNTSTVDLSGTEPFKTEHNDSGRRAALKITASVTEEIHYRGSIATYKVRGSR